MRTTARIFTILMVFFLIVGTVYGFMSATYEPLGLEPVGFYGILLLGGLSAMIAAVLGMNARRHPDRPEDDDEAPVSADAGIQGSFSPFSWWPWWVSIAAALCFLGVAAGWWIPGLGAVLAIYAITGWVMEFSRGQFAH